MTLYIYDQNLKLVGFGDKRRMESGILVDHYIQLGYIVSVSKLF
jgi:hypothetical protein